MPSGEKQNGYGNTSRPGHSASRGQAGPRNSPAEGKARARRRRRARRPSKKLRYAGVAGDITSIDLDVWMRIEDVPGDEGIDLATVYWMLDNGSKELGGKKPATKPYRKPRKNGKVLTALVVRRDEWKRIGNARRLKAINGLKSVAELAKDLKCHPNHVLVLRKDGGPLGEKGATGAGRGWLFTEDDAKEIKRRESLRPGKAVLTVKGLPCLTQSQAMRKYENARPWTFNWRNKVCPQLGGETLRAFLQPGQGRMRSPDGTVWVYPEEDLSQLIPPVGSGKRPPPPRSSTMKPSQGGEQIKTPRRRRGRPAGTVDKEQQTQLGRMKQAWIEDKTRPKGERLYPTITSVADKFGFQRSNASAFLKKEGVR
jgi:hypothetical protein